MELKGITEDEFNPLELFQKEGKRVPRISWTIPESAALREKIMAFLEWNETSQLTLYGGCIEKVEIDTLHHKSLQHLFLRNMPTIVMDNVYKSLPQL